MSLCCWQFVAAHLSFLQFILQEGGLYLPWHRARDIWDTLVASPQASDCDRDVSLLFCLVYRCKQISLPVLSCGRGLCFYLSLCVV